jgi:hypothetical protein
MAIENSTFENYAPIQGGIYFLYRIYLGNVILRAMNISSTACEGINVFDGLSSLTAIVIEIGGVEYTLNITNFKNKGTYYNFDFVDITVGPTSGNEIIAQGNTPTSCKLVKFLPSLSDSSFNNSDYDVQINNINEQRRSAYVQDVDRKRSQVEPANLTAILNDSAIKTDVPDSNYSDTGLTNARYYGSETSETDFGLTAALSAQAFKGYTYRNNDVSTLICSASDDDRPTEAEYVFAIDKDYSYGNLNTSFDLGNSNIVSRSVMRETDSPNMRLTQVRTTTLKTTLTVIDTEIVLRDLDLDVTQDFSTGLYVIGTPGSVMEYVNVTDVSFNGTNTVITVQRRALSYLGITSNCGIIYGPNTNTIFTILKVTGDTIYGTESNQIFKITDKKIYYPTTNEIFVVDKNGMIVYTDTTCLR